MKLTIDIRDNYARQTYYHHGTSKRIEEGDQFGVEFKKGLKLKVGEGSMTWQKLTWVNLTARYIEQKVYEERGNYIVTYRLFFEFEPYPGLVLRFQYHELGQVINFKYLSEDPS